MDIMIFTGLLLVGGLLNFIWEPSVKTVHCLAKCYLLLAIYLAFVVWVFYFAGIKNTFLLNALDILLRYGSYLAHLALGFLAGYILVGVRNAKTPADRFDIQAILNITLWAISVSIGNSFIVATVGKSMNMPYMIGFFKQSGYAIWFLYFIMIVESTGAAGILLHFKLKMGALASIGLALIMLGAIYTHWHNNDSFSDSYAAVSQLINLAMILLLYYLEKRVKPKPADTQIYVV
jgi:putative oxidoreductase